MKKLAASLLVATACISGAMAQSMPAPALSAKAWLLLDETSGQVIASHAATSRIEPASLTKIMTAYVVFDALTKKELTASQLVTISTRAWKVPAGSSKMFLEPNSKVSVDDLLRGLMLVLMTLTHLPTRLTNPFGQPFGYVSAAEGFVLLSGYMAGLVYGRLAFRQGIAPMFPFGFGMSYTSFELSDIAVDDSKFDPDGAVSVYVTVVNTGARAGSEVVQLYVGDESSSVPRPAKELKAFAKVHLGPGDTARVKLDLKDRDFAFYSIEAKHWLDQAVARLDATAQASPAAADPASRISWDVRLEHRLLRRCNRFWLMRQQKDDSGKRHRAHY